MYFLSILASMEPMMSSELMSFLMPMGWSVDEFSALRTYGVRPPSEISAADLNELAEQNAQVSQKLILPP